MGYIEMKNNVKQNEKNMGYYSGNTNILQTLVDASFDFVVLSGKLFWKFFRWSFDYYWPVKEEIDFNILWEELSLHNKVGNMPIAKDVKIGNRSNFYTFTIPTGLCIEDFKNKEKQIAQFLNEDIKDIKIELINNLAAITVNKMKNISFNYKNYNFKKYSKGELKIPIGINLKNWDIQTWSPNNPNTPHLLIAGNTGGGKSTVLYIILSFISQYRNDVDLYIQDVKYTDLPYFEHLAKRYNEGKNYAVETLKELVEIMEDRHKYIKAHGKRCANELNEKDKLNSIIYVLEELNAFNPKKDQEFYSYLGELLSRGRGANISVITVTQSPYATTLPGDLKNNYPAVIGLKTSTSEASKVVCGQYDKLNRLRGKGHGYMFSAEEEDGESEFQGFNIELETIEEIVKNKK